jgi:hypothetical protein
MSLGSLKTIVGFTLVGIHVIAIVLLYWWVSAMLSPQEFRITVMILVPVSAVYVGAFLRDSVRHMFADVATPTEDRPITLSFAILASCLTALFGLLVIYNLYDFAHGANITADDLKDRLLIIETMAGGFLGIIVETLFREAPRENAHRVRTQPRRR